MMISPMHSLTIAIPSYNRAKPLLGTLKALLPQLSPSTELIILDNCSDTPCQEVYNEAAQSAPHDRNLVKVIRHPSNIGMQANILRCFELSQAEWIWILSDDDMPTENAVSLALDTSRLSPPNTTTINFSSSVGPRSSSFTTNGCDEFLTRMDHFGSFMFISANLYRVEPLRRQLRYGYTYGYSQAAFFAMLLLSLGATGGVSFESTRLVEFSRPAENRQKWSSISLMLGISCLLELPLDIKDISHKQLERQLMTLALPPTALLKAVMSQPKTRDPGIHRIFEQCFLRCYISGTVVRWPLLKFFICRILLRLPKNMQIRLIRLFGKESDPTVNTEIGSSRLERF
jgi:Glycosyl transferase family 2